jgi:hypothetical protein
LCAARLPVNVNEMGGVEEVFQREYEEQP